jgi:adenosylhomocysteinase
MANALVELEQSILEDPALAAEGAERIAWARANMPVLAGLRAEFERERPLDGHRIGMCLHVESKTAVLVQVLRAGGAELVATGSPATTDDGVAAALAEDSGIRIYGRRADTLDDHYDHIRRVLESDPDLLLDNGADLIAGTIERGGGRVFAATEETTSGANRLREDLQERVPFPVVVINDSPVKQLFENQYGIGPAVLDGFLRATNCLVAATTFAVVGYGSCGRSLCRTLRALGASVISVERNAIRALEAAYDGMLVMDLAKALERAQVVVTVTGRPGVLGRDELLLLRDGAMLANVGHFATEIDVRGLEEMAVETNRLNPHVVEYRLQNGRAVRLLGRGEMLNLSAATGHQIQIMDLGFALQAHSLRALARSPGDFALGPQPVPDEINLAIATEALRTLGTVDLS